MKVTQSTVLADDQGHDTSEAVITTWPSPPSLVKFVVGGWGDIMNVHGGMAMVMLQLAVAVWAELSVTVPVKGNDAAAAGVPVTPPKEFKLKPVGRDPFIMPND